MYSLTGPNCCLRVEEPWARREHSSEVQIKMVVNDVRRKLLEGSEVRNVFRACRGQKALRTDHIPWQEVARQPGPPILPAFHRIWIVLVIPGLHKQSP
jgi:hypothetical protein